MVTNREVKSTAHTPAVPNLRCWQVFIVDSMQCKKDAGSTHTVLEYWVADKYLAASYQNIFKHFSTFVLVS